MEQTSINRPEAFENTAFVPVVRHQGELTVFDLTEVYDVDVISNTQWGIGRYNEKRKNMYTAPQYESRRNIHMGIDIWTPAGEAVYAFYKGKLAYKGNNDRRGDYGPTLVTEHHINGIQLFALYGHLSRDTLDNIEVGDTFKAGDQLGAVGSAAVNGGWEPHLHFQLSWYDPGEADMPGVVSSGQHKKALSRYPDPRIVLGKLY